MPDGDLPRAYPCALDANSLEVHRPGQPDGISCRSAAGRRCWTSLGAMTIGRGGENLLAGVLHKQGQEYSTERTGRPA